MRPGNRVTAASPLRARTSRHCASHVSSIAGAATIIVAKTGWPFNPAADEASAEPGSGAVVYGADAGGETPGEKTDAATKAARRASPLPSRGSTIALSVFNT